jgi:hypothetical protein
MSKENKSVSIEVWHMYGSDDHNSFSYLTLGKQAERVLLKRNRYYSFLSHGYEKCEKDT